MDIVEMPQAETVHYIGPHFTPAMMFAAHAPEPDKDFKFKDSSDPQPQQPLLPAWDEEQRQELNAWRNDHLDADDITDPDVKHYVQEWVAWKEEMPRWEARMRVGRAVAWRLHWAQLMLAAAVKAEPTYAGFGTLQYDAAKLLESPGAFAIAEERARQVNEEGYTTEHDDEHDQGELALAAAWYAMPFEQINRLPPGALTRMWPEGWEAPRSSEGNAYTIAGRKRDLEKAGAMCAAEWDRLHRLQLEGTPTLAEHLPGEDA